MALPSSTSCEDDKVPIRVAPKFKGSAAAKRRKHRPPPTDDNFGFSDPISEFYQGVSLDPNGELIRKRLHPVPVHEPHSTYDVSFNPSIRQPLLDALDLDHLTNGQQSRLLDLLKEFWCVFNPDGRVVPVRDYTCSIDTGNHPGVYVKNPTYGPHESPIIDKSIAALLKVGQVSQVYGGSWLSKALLAPKPHQEKVTHIDNFVWRFCVSYVALNAVTKVIRWPIPRCDDASDLYIGSRFFWLMDAPSGFHQLEVDKSSKPKLAFAGTQGDKYTYNVMPFGPVNGPAIFIMFIHDMNSSWKDLAKSRGIPIGRNCNTRIIVDDILSWASTFDIALKYMRCQFMRCRNQRLSLSLTKSLFFNPRIEFVGQDLCADGNRPAQSKHKLLQSWPTFRIARDIASFLGFINFYSKYIPFMEQRISHLRALAKKLPDMDSSVSSLLQDVHLKERDDIIQAILSDPCLQRYDPDWRTYLSTDFSA
ncbi:reverse transcriptase domain-containing protein, partial [Roseibium sp.]|uniref:reverse transcriptase family protein n=1 Tax=Roseibium sp. TaxID=1936156 RepID=UPI003918F8A4